VEVKAGDIYIRHSDTTIWSVKKIDNKMVVLESADKFRLSLTNIFALEKAYKKEESEPARQSPSQFGNQRKAVPTPST